MGVLMEPDYLWGCPDDFVPPDVAAFGKRYVKRWQASAKRLRTYDFWRQLFYSAALTRFEWVNLPHGIDARYLELLLLGWGAAAATRRGEGEIIPYWVGRCSMNGNRDLYNNPNAITMISPNGVTQRRHANWWVSHAGSNGHERKSRIMRPNACICWDNMMRLPILPQLDLFAQRLAEMDTTIDQHSMALRVPYIIGVEEGGEKNAEALYNRIAAGEGAVYYYRGGPAAVPIQVLTTMPAAAYAGDKLLNDQGKLISRAYTFLGIDNNAAAEKKERVQTAETLANNEQFMMQRMSAMRPRQEFLQKCRDILGGPWWETEVKWAVPHIGEMQQAVQGFEASAPSTSFSYGSGDQATVWS